jgi:hypothetical protein
MYTTSLILNHGSVESTLLHLMTLSRTILEDVAFLNHFNLSNCIICQTEMIRNQYSCTFDCLKY